MVTFIPNHSRLLTTFCTITVWLLWHADNTNAQVSPPVTSSGTAATHIQFERDIAPILTKHCVQCHNQNQAEGGLALDSAKAIQAGGDSGPVIETASSVKPTPGKTSTRLSHTSRLIQAITLQKDDSRPAMPKGAQPLDNKQVELLRLWIDQGAHWPDEIAQLVWEDPRKAQWWSLQPLIMPKIPAANANTVALSNDDSQAIAGTSTAENSTGSENSTGPEKSTGPVDAFIRSKLAEQDLAGSHAADKRTLIRRVCFDLLGLPPSYEEITRFAQDDRPDAYERLIDRLLSSPAYGERWARHWLDVVHYGETHGYDKDKPRSYAWPYRDYVIDSFNEDTPYRQFVREQVAGDVLWPEEPRANVAMGFLSAGPWDFIGHAEVPESKFDGKLARHLDRDDMVQNTFLTFQSTTVGCAQCHNHKFDPIDQREYYGLQAVFAALDRADKFFYQDKQLQSQYSALTAKKTAAERQLRECDEKIHSQTGEDLTKILDEIRREQSKKSYPVEHGYHSAIVTKQDAIKWVQIDLGSVHRIAEVEWIACHDFFANIGEGFGAPIDWKIELALHEDMQDATVIADSNRPDKATGITPHRFRIAPADGRYVRFTASKLAERKNDYIFALAELRIFDLQGKNIALEKAVTALDSIEAPTRWRLTNLVDGKFPVGASADKLEALETQRKSLLQARVPEPLLALKRKTETEIESIDQALKALPKADVVYVATIHRGSGNFVGTAQQDGKPRRIEVLPRGDLKQTGPEATPCAPHCVSALNPDLGSSSSSDAQRRKALALWLTDDANGLTWRSIVNRLWAYHFEHGIVRTANDFGRMGDTPSHPELLDYLAIRLRDHQSLKSIHREILLSSTYRQSSQVKQEQIALDPENRWLSHFPRHRLEAEAIRDSILSASGLLRREMYGPSFRDFVIERPEHSPHYEYELHDPRDPEAHRRCIYRFIVRSQTQPWLTALDCADPSLQVDSRSQSTSAAQALAMLNNRFILMAADHWGTRIEARMKDSSNVTSNSAMLEEMFANATGRMPKEQELQAMQQLLSQSDFATVARLLFNLNEFVYID